MLASKIRLEETRAEELLEFLPEHGKIYLNGSRMVIFDTTSLGKLRKNLIETLGIDRAKGFLMRHGWSCGFEVAMSIKEQFQRYNKMEWIYAGTNMHTITGHALVLLNGEMDIEIIQSKCVNSFEAEQHILNLGYYHEPVCWTLVGYASGYVTACLGKKFIFKEVECAGQGDEHCLLIGKTIEDWGEEITSELPYYEDSKISEELEVAHQKLKTQNKFLERTDTIRERLAQCILNDKGAKDIAATLAELMNCTVVLEDTNLIILSISVPEQTDTEDLLTPYLPIMTSPSFKNSSTLHHQKRTFQLNDQFSNILVNRLVAPIRVCNRLFGFVSLLRPELPFTEFDSKALEQASIILALEILKEKEIAEVEWRLKGDFVDELLSGNFSDPNSIINRAFGLNYNITLPHRVLVLEIHNFTQLVKSFKQNEKKILQFKTELASTVEACLKRFGKGMVVNRSDKIIMLVQLNKPDSPERDTRQFAENIIEQISYRFPTVTPSVGIGDICTELPEFSHSYLCAQKAIDIGKIMNKKGQVLSLDQFAAHALLFSALNPTDLYSFATNQIGALLEYDETNNAQLIPTLQELLNHRSNVEATARTLNMSVGGLKYRLQRIEEITGQDLKDSQTCFNLQLGLNILQLTGTDKLKSQ